MTTPLLRFTSALTAGLLWVSPLMAGEPEDAFASYPPELLRSLFPGGVPGAKKQKVDMSAFEKGLALSPGFYSMSVNVNHRPTTGRKVELRLFEGRLEPVFAVKDLMRWPLRDSVMKDLAEKNPDEELFPLSAHFEGAKAEVDGHSQTIDVSLAQRYVKDESGWVDIAPEALWEDGINGAIVTANVTAAHLKTREGPSIESADMTATFNGQMNIGPWRFFSNVSMTGGENRREGQSESRFETNLWNTYLERDWRAVKGIVSAGEITTAGDIFESFPAEGIRLRTNEGMLPVRDRAYTPIVEGVAETEATIIVRQHDRIIQSINVAPGPFRLDQLPVMARDGEIEVVIREADGKERLLSVPYASVPRMLKAGQYRYDLAAGRYSRDEAPENSTGYFLTGTLEAGLPLDVTMSGGLLLSENYRALNLGSALSLGPAGAMSLDMTYAKTDEEPALGRAASDGSSWRLRYEKTFERTGTSITFTHKRRPETGYRDFAETFSEKRSDEEDSPRHASGMKSDWNAVMAQPLGRFGAVSAGYSETKVREREGDYRSYHVNYAVNLKGVGVSARLSRDYRRNPDDEWAADKRFFVTVSLPFDLFWRENPLAIPEAVRGLRAEYGGTFRESPTGTTETVNRLSLSGSSLDGNLGWNLSVNDNNRQSSEAGASLNWTGNRMAADAGITQNKRLTSMRFGFNGGLLLHADGLTPMRTTSGSVVLVEVPDLEGVTVKSAPDRTTDSNGFLVLDYLTDYSRNDVIVNASSLPEGALMLDYSDRTIYPTRGSINKVTFNVRMGTHALFIFKEAGVPLPFGSVVTLLDASGQDDRSVQGIVGEGGRVYLTGIPAEGRLAVTRGENGTRLLIDYRVEAPETPTEDGGFRPIRRITVDCGSDPACRPEGEAGFDPATRLSDWFDVWANLYPTLMDETNKE